ncbi:MAG: hypothetical protein NVS3B10_27530 [Polyangiales bacterium]
MRAPWPVVLSLPLLACAASPAPRPKSLVERKMDSIAAMASRGTSLPPALEGGRLSAADVELLLPAGCAPLDATGMASTALQVDDADSQLLAACNVVVDDAQGRHVPVTLVLIRHFVQVETGESAAAALLRSPAVLSATTTTTARTADDALGPEVVITLNAPSSPTSRPSTALWYGALDGLYVLYAEIDGDAASIAAWGDTLASALRPTASSHPIRWRAPTTLSPSRSAFGPFEIKLPEKVGVVSKTFDDLIGAADPLAAHEGRAFVTLRDETGFALGGSISVARLLPPFAATPAALAELSAIARGVTGLTTSTVASTAGAIARVDGTNARGDHEVWAALASSSDEATVVHFVVARSKWDAYAPLIGASLGTWQPASEPPY